MQGTKVSVPGTQVMFAGYRVGYGFTIILDHGDGLSTLYSQCSSLLVSKGNIVEAGEKIALVGSTGDSTGNHAHFEVRINGEAVNPLDYFEENNASTKTNIDIYEKFKNVFEQLSEEDSNETIIFSLNGKVLEFDQFLEVQNGDLLVPMDILFDAIGADIHLLEETCIIAVKNDIKLIMVLDENKIIKLVGEDIEEFENEYNNGKLEGDGTYTVNNYLKNYGE